MPKSNSQLSKRNQQAPKVGQLQVWWVPQVPMKEFAVDVASPQEAAKLLAVLAAYDLFQLENKIKPDYSNMGGLRVWDADADGEGHPGWIEWHNENDDDVDAAFDIAKIYSQIRAASGAPNLHSV